MKPRKPFWKKIIDRHSFIYFCSLEYGYCWNDLVSIAYNNVEELNKLFIQWINSPWFSDCDRDYLIKNLNLDYVG